MSLLNSRPVGTGPFMFAEWVPDDHFTAVRNPHYWRSDIRGRRLPYLDSITYKPLPLVSERRAGISSGALGAIHTDDPQTILDIRRDPALAHVEDATTGIGTGVTHDTDAVLLNTGTPPFDDVNLRRAFAGAFDQRKWLQVGCLDVDLPANGPFQEGNIYHASTGYPTYDPSTAKALVSAYVDAHGGSRPVVQCAVENTPRAVEAAQFVVESLDAVGFDTRVVPVEQSALVDDATFGRQSAVSWRFPGNIDPDLSWSYWSAPASGGITLSSAFSADRVLETAMTTGRRSAQLDVRRRTYKTLARQLGESCAYIWADERVWSVAARQDVQNFDNPTTPDGRQGLGMLSGIIWPTEIWRDSADRTHRADRRELRP